MNDDLEMLKEVSGGKEENTDGVKCPSCGSEDTSETGSYLSSRDQCLVHEYRCNACGHTFEINR